MLSLKPTLRSSPMPEKNPSADKPMKIGELAARSGVAPSTIRFYEASGLLPAATRGINGYRLYSQDALRQLLIIQTAQRLGFPLDAVRGSLASGAGVPHELILQKLQDRLTEIDTMQAALAAQRQQVASMLATLQQSWAAGECLELEVLAQPLAALPSSLSKRRKGQAGG